MEHELKTWPEFFQQIVTGEKTVELRKNDRDFKAGDTLYLREYRPDLQIYTGKETRVTVTSLLKNFVGLKRGYCVMSVKLSPGELTRWNAAKAGKRK